MVDMKTETKPVENKPAVNPRLAIREARQRRLRLASSTPATIKVYAANSDFRDYLYHSNGTRFREDGSAEWPNDSFTARLISDGAVLTDGPGSDEPMAEPDESLNPRQQAEAMKPKPKEPKEEPTNGKPEAKSAPRSQPQPQSQPQSQPPAA